MPCSDVPPPASATAPPLALITGASRGLGAGFAEALAADGWAVLAVARDRKALEKLDDRIRSAGGQATLAPMDLAAADTPLELAAAIAARWGGLSFWVHCAVAAPALSPASQTDPDAVTGAATLNIGATARLIGALEPVLRLSGGKALFLDDPLAGQAFSGAYGATKAGQIALARAWAREGRRIGPRVHILTPRPSATALRARFFPGENRDRLADPRQEAQRMLGLMALPATRGAPAATLQN